jgi:hypothetical protein
MRFREHIQNLILINSILEKNIDEKLPYKSKEISKLYKIDYSKLENIIYD